jgi:hypothetical protein
MTHLSSPAGMTCGSTCSENEIAYGSKIETVEKRGVVSAGVALPGGLG